MYIAWASAAYMYIHTWNDFVNNSQNAGSDHDL